MTETLVSLLSDTTVSILGGLLSASFCRTLSARRNRWIFWLGMAVMLIPQGAVYLLWNADLSVDFTCSTLMENGQFILRLFLQLTDCLTVYSGHFYCNSCAKSPICASSLYNSVSSLCNHQGPGERLNRRHGDQCCHPDHQCCAGSCWRGQRLA